MRGLTAFREAWMASDPPHVLGYETFEARQLRYAIFYAFYENTAYRRVHSWAVSYKHPFAMYDDVRNLYNPATQIADLSSALIWGGPLNRDAEAKGAIPIECEEPKLRAAVARLWTVSRLATQKDVWTLRGCIEGDLAIRVVDEVAKKRVYLERIPPETLEWVDFDALGNVKGYVIAEERQQPDSPSRTVDYREVVSRKGDLVVYETYLNGKEFAWPGQDSWTWAVPYSFVPMCLVKHKDTGLDWGASEFLCGMTKFRELDDLASMLSDYIRKVIDPGWFVSGIDDESDLTFYKADRDLAGEYPEPGREDTKILFGPKDSKMDAMVADLNIADALAHVAALVAELEKVFPLLQTDIWATGATSGRALRVARQRVEQMLRLRRESYDSGLVRVQKMALSVGGYRKYPGFESFSLESYEAGALDHSIADRPVFAPDPLDDAEAFDAFWEAAGKAVKAGASLEGFLRKAGWSDEEIALAVVTEDTNQEEDAE